MPQSFHTFQTVGRDSLAGKVTSGGRLTDEFRPNSFVTESSTSGPAKYREFVFGCFFGGSKKKA